MQGLRHRKIISLKTEWGAQVRVDEVGSIFHQTFNRGRTPKQITASVISEENFEIGLP